MCDREGVVNDSSPSRSFSERTRSELSNDVLFIHVKDKVLVGLGGYKVS